ncbi:MAG: MarR family transcriptional regulator [Myxococcota bacterium]
MRVQTTKIRQSREELERASWHSVVRTYLECGRRFGRLLREFQLTVTQYEVLLAIGRLGENAVPHAIADSLFVTRANISGVLRRLEGDGLVSTHKHPADRRSSICSLTDAGTKRVRDAQTAAELFVREQTGGTTDSQLEFIMSIMQQVEGQLRQMDPVAIAQQARGQA